MAKTPMTAIRVDPAMLDAVRKRHGLVDASVSTVMRFALALAGGSADPVDAAHIPMGRRPTWDDEGAAA